jgi:hypothetical protein
MSNKPRNNEHSRFTNYKPEQNFKNEVPKFFQIDFGGDHYIKSAHTKVYRLNQVSPTSDLTKSDFALLNNVWKEYDSNVQYIFDTVFEKGKPKQLRDDDVQKLCILVRIMSQILCKVYPYNTDGFYGLPLFVTASEDGTQQSKDWAHSSYSLGDHWMINSEDKIWIAYRQETGYFFTVYDCGSSVHSDLWHPTMKKIEMLISNVYWQPMSLFNSELANKCRDKFYDLEIKFTL